jgi:uncharacterized membrane protein
MVYSYLVLIHVIAVIIFLGNITIAPFWKVHADKSKDRLKIADTFNGIIRADRYFTMPGVAILLIFGLGAALHGGYNLLETGWIFWAIILYVISGTVFMAKVVPIQKKIYKLASSESDFTWEKYQSLSKQWNVWGSVATLAPWLAVILMVVKPVI